MLKWIVSNLADGPLRDDVQQIIRHKLTIKFNKYDWEINNASSEATIDADALADQEYQTTNSEALSLSSIQEL